MSFLLKWKTFRKLLTVESSTLQKLLFSNCRTSFARSYLESLATKNVIMDDLRKNCPLMMSILTRSDVDTVKQ